jgi:hypothetical protein
MPIGGRQFDHGAVHSGLAAQERAKFSSQGAKIGQTGWIKQPIEVGKLPNISIKSQMGGRVYDRWAVQVSEIDYEMDNWKLASCGQNRNIDKKLLFSPPQ